MKRLMRLLTSCAAFAALALSCSAYADTISKYTVDGIEWSFRHIDDRRVQIYNDGAAAISTATSGFVQVPYELQYEGRYRVVTDIGPFAFYQCDKITGVELDQFVEDIGESAFRACTSLKSIVIPCTVKSIGKWAFFNTALKYVYVDKDDTDRVKALFTAADYDWSTLEFIEGKSPRYSKSDSETGITWSCLLEFGGTEWLFDEYDATIFNYDYVANKPTPAAEGNVFGTVEIPSALTVVTGWSATAVEWGWGLWSYTRGYVRTIGEGAFANIKTIGSVKTTSVETIGENAFSGCTSLTDFIGYYVTEIAPQAFKGCTSLRAYNSKDGLVILSGVRSAGREAFKDCTSIASIEGFASMTEIPEGMFSGCTSLKYAYLGSAKSTSALKTIGARALEGCNGGVEVRLPKTVTSLGSGAFAGCGKLTVYMHESLIDKFDFDDVFGDSTPTVYFYDNSGDIVKLIGYADGYRWYCDILDNGNLQVFRQSPGGGGMCAVYPEPSGSLIIPGGLANRRIQEIGPNAFAGCNKITGVYTVNGADLTTIGWEAFANCANLERVSLGSSVTLIGYSAFKGCYHLNALNLSDRDLQISTSAFEGCVSLPIVYLSEKITLAGENQFKGCSALRRVYMPSAYASEANIKSRCFSGCPDDLGLIFATAEDGIYREKDANGMFWYFSLKSYYNGDDEFLYTGAMINRNGVAAFDSPSTPTGVIDVPDTLGGIAVTEIGDYAFCDCDNITQINGMPYTLKAIGHYAFADCSNLKRVTLGDEVETLGDSLFSFCTSLTDVNIPSGVTTIPKYSFENCTALTSIAIPDTVKTIGDSAFQSCSALVNLDLGKGVRELGQYAFMFCLGLEEVALPGSLQTVKSGVFNNCVGLKKVYINGAPGENFHIREQYFAGCRSDLDIVWPVPGWYGGEGTVLVGDDECWEYSSDGAGGAAVIACEMPVTVSKMTSVTVPSTLNGLTVTAIGDHAFHNGYSVNSYINIRMPLLKFITLPTSVTTIGDYAFADCEKLNRTGFGLTSKITSIGKYAYMGCNLATIDVPDTVTSIGEGAFKNNAILRSVSLPGSFFDNIDPAVFEGCNENLVITFRKVVGDTDVTAQMIDGHLWYFEDNGNSATVAGPQIGAVIYNAVSPAPTGALVIPSSLGGKRVTAIGERAFEDFTGITSVKIPESVTSIDGYAFAGCTGLTSVDIPAKVTTLADYAFKDCTSLASASLPGALNGIDEFKVFNNCAPGKIITYRNKGGITSQVVDGRTWYYRVENGEAEIFFSEDYGSYSWHRAVQPDPTDEDDVVIPPTLGANYPVTKIGKYAFYECEMSSVTIPDSVKEIDDYAFQYCRSLAEVNFGSGLVAIGKSAFSYCDMLGGIELPEGVVTIGASAFANCSWAATLTIPDGVLDIGDAAFYNCSSLESVTVPESVTSLGINAFHSCTKLSTVSLPTELTDIGYQAFGNCTSLTDVTLATQAAVDSFKTIFTLHLVKKVTIGSGVKTIPDAMCYDPESSFTPALEKIKLSDTVEVIGEGAFYGCADLEGVDLPEGLVTVKRMAFCGTGIEYISVPVSLKTVEEYAFAGSTSLQSVLFADGVKAIPSSMLSGCTGISSIMLPSSVTSIGARSFSGCSGLSQINIPAGVDAIGMGAFTDCPLSLVHVAARDTARVKAMLVASGLEQSFVDGITFFEEDPPFWFISFDPNGGVASSSLYEIPPFVALGELPTAVRTGGYDFLGWFTEPSGGEQITDETPATADVTYYAHWRLKTWTVAFEAGDGASSVSPVVLDHGHNLAELGELPEPKRDGYEFRGWFNGDGEAIDAFAAVTANATYYARWVKLVTIGFYMVVDGVVDAEPFMTEVRGVGDDLNLNAVVDSENLKLLGWSLASDGALLPNPTTVEVVDGMNVYEQFAHAVWLVTFDAVGGDCDTARVSVAKGDKLTALPSASRDGCRFVGWFTAPSGGEAVTTPVDVSSDVTFYARWKLVATVDGYTYTYKVDADTTAIISDDGLVAVTPSPSGTYTVPGALAGRAVSKIGDGAYAGLTGLTSVLIPDGVTAIGAGAFRGCSNLQSVRIPPSVETIGAGAFADCPSLDTIYLAHGDTARVSAMLVASGLDEALVAAMTFTEDPGPTHYVYFNGNGGTVSPSVVLVEEGQAIGELLATPYREGWTFNGWQDADGAEVTVATIVTSDMYCTAQWSENVTPPDPPIPPEPTIWSVLIDANGGTFGEMDAYYASVEDGQALGELLPPARDGWTFNGWQDADGAEVTEATIVTSDMHCYAQWIENVTPPDPPLPPEPTYWTVTFYAHGGTFGDTDVTAISVEDGTAIGDMLPTPAREGWTFGGWFKDQYGEGEQVTAATIVTEDFPCYAFWFIGVDPSLLKTEVVNGIKWTYYDEGGQMCIFNNGSPAIPSDTKGAITIPAKLGGKNVGTIGSMAFNGCSGLTSVVIPDTVSRVKDSAFCACSELQFVQFGKQMSASFISVIEGEAFANCGKLTAIEFKGAPPYIASDDAFAGAGTDTPYQCQVYVPKSSAKAWGDTWLGMRVNKYAYSVPIYVNYSEPTEANVYGKIAVSGGYEVGKKLTLKATANKNYVFGGWYDGVTGELVTRAASFAYTIVGETRSFLADFETLVDDAASIEATFNSGEFVFNAGNTLAVKTIPCGVYLEWPVAATALSQTTVKISGLPSGLKFTAKDIMKKGSKTEVDIPANTIYGTPTAASKTDKFGAQVPSTVKITVTTAGKSTANYVLQLTVDPLPDWAVGTFDGYTDGGQLSMSVTAAGKISGKCLVDGMTFTTSAAGFDLYDDLTETYLATLTVKVGSEVTTTPVTISNPALGGEVLFGDPAIGELFQTKWKTDADWKALGKMIASKTEYTYDDNDTAQNIYRKVSLKVAATGVVTTKIEVWGSTSYKGSGSAVLIPRTLPDSTGAFTCDVAVYIPPKKGKFGGYYKLKSLTWNPTTRVFVINP